MEDEQIKDGAPVAPSTPKEEITKYEFGDMYLECSCGHEQLVAESVPGGIRFDVYTTDKHDIALVCGGCGTKLRLFFKEAANPPQPATDEKLEPTDEETIKEVNNEPVPETDKAKA